MYVRVYRSIIGYTQYTYTHTYAHAIRRIPSIGIKFLHAYTSITMCITQLTHTHTYAYTGVSNV